MDDVHVIRRLRTNTPKAVILLVVVSALIDIIIPLTLILGSLTHLDLEPVAARSGTECGQL